MAEQETHEGACLAPRTDPETLVLSLVVTPIGTGVAGFQISLQFYTQLPNSSMQQVLGAEKPNKQQQQELLTKELLPAAGPSAAASLRLLSGH